MQIAAVSVNTYSLLLYKGGIEFQTMNSIFRCVWQILRNGIKHKTKFFALNNSIYFAYQCSYHLKCFTVVIVQRQQSQHSQNRLIVYINSFCTGQVYKQFDIEFI